MVLIPGCGACGCLNVCECSGVAKTVPSALVLYLTVDSVGEDLPGKCSLADARAFLQGTYVLPFSSYDNGSAFYATTLSNGVSIEIQWRCSSPIYPYSASHLLTITSCNIYNVCFARVEHVQYVTALFVCNIATGFFYSFGFSQGVNTWKGPIANCTGAGTIASYFCSFYISTSW